MWYKLSIALFFYEFLSLFFFFSGMRTSVEFCKDARRTYHSVRCGGADEEGEDGRRGDVEGVGEIRVRVEIKKK